MTKNTDKIAIAQANGVGVAKKAAGSGAALARLLGLERHSVLHWKKIPAERVIKIEEVTGVPRETLRPDLYRDPKKDATTKAGEIV